MDSIYINSYLELTMTTLPTKEEMMEGFHGELEGIGWDYDYGGKKSAKILAKYWLNLISKRDATIKAALLEEMRNIKEKYEPAYEEADKYYVKGLSDAMDAVRRVIHD